MKLTYKKRVFGYFFIIFALFAIAIIIFERNEERKFKEEILEAKLDSYAEVIHAYIVENKLSKANIDSLRQLSEALPSDIRLTIIDTDGKVIFDKNVDNLSSLENHLDRPEIRKSMFHPSGTNIRVSASTKQEYLYYAKSYPAYYVRVALPYNIQTQGMLQPDNLFIYITLVMFIVVLILLNAVASRFGKSISQLKQFTIDVKNGKDLPHKLEFPDDEVGEIGQELLGIFEQREKSKHDLEAEREKLIQHFQYSEEGLGIFSPDKKKIYANTHFIQYLNFIINKLTFDVESLFNIEEFKKIQELLHANGNSQNYITFQINKNGKIFQVRSVVFEDKSFEITIKDITRTEKNRILKQEMTNSIAHELRTPVTSIRGYLETLHGIELPAEKQKQFIDNAYKQSIRLSLLIDDISLISKIEEAPTSFAKEKVHLAQIISNVRIDLADKLNEKHIQLYISVPDDLVIQGNYTLLYSVFRNLMENSIAYAGDNISIYIDCYMQNDTSVYLSYYDTGIGVPEQHLNRLFERFYRVNEGRTRDKGGSGLGLSIVKNSVLLHKGEIQVRNHTGGGLEFLFNLHK